MKASPFESLYKRITHEFRQFILNEDWPVNEMIPTEQELCQKYSVSRLTIRNALARLVHEGLLERRSGKGTWVRDFRESPGKWTMEDVSQYFAYPEHIRTEILGVEHFVAGSSGTINGKFENNEIISRIKILRLFKQTPFAFNHIYLREVDATPVMETFNPERDIYLHQILEKQIGRMVVEIQERIKATVAAGDVAKKLKVDPGYPLLEIHRDLFDQEGYLMQSNLLYINSDLQEMKAIRTKKPHLEDG